MIMCDEGTRIGVGNIDPVYQFMRRFFWWWLGSLCVFDGKFYK